MLRYCLIAILFLTASAFGQPAIKRTVVDNSIVSEGLPAITIKIDEKFKYVGKFDFTIRDVARGERFVFVDARKKRIDRLFIAQFEAILPTSTEIYRYNFDKALLFGPHRFRQNTFAYSNSEARRENPAGEAALTETFLKEKGYMLEDELMMSRFLTVPDAEKKHELILFYIENVTSTKRRLSDFYAGDNETDVWRSISAGLTQRSRQAFSIA